MAGSKLLGACIAVSVVGIIVYGIGFASPYWFEVGTRHVGLFLFCDPSGLKSSCISVYNADVGLTEVWVTASEAMASIGLFCALGGLVTAVVWSCNGPSKAVCSVAALLFFLAGTFGVISVAVFAPMSGVDVEVFSWALWLTVVGSALFFVSGIISTVASCSLNKVSHFDY